MGDLQRSLSIMLAEGGCDENLLHDEQGNYVIAEKPHYMFAPMDQMVLRQYECGSEPAVLLSKFFQRTYPTFHLILFHLRVRIAQMREPKFLMYGDVSHSDFDILSNRSKSETVLSNSVEKQDDTGRVNPMVPCVADFRRIFADDLEVRCGLCEWEDKNKTILVDVERLPPDLAISCLLNPMVGGKSVWVDAFLWFLWRIYAYNKWLTLFSGLFCSSQSRSQHTKVKNV